MNTQVRMFAVLKTCNNLYLNIETTLKVFDVYVSSLSYYGCEVWGFQPWKGYFVSVLNMSK